ncbi:MAG TPA: hypothetical protein VND64_26925, partial [Pirellulales bacterium]|nr:hypothetical protein [Pirellulales bacterium]
MPDARAPQRAGDVVHRIGRLIETADVADGVAGAAEPAQVVRGVETVGQPAGPHGVRGLLAAHDRPEGAHHRETETDRHLFPIARRPEVDRFQNVADRSRIEDR